MRYHPRRFRVPLIRIVLLSVVIICGVTSGCSLNRKTRITSGSVSVEYQKGGDITIRAPKLSLQLNSRHALFVSLLFDNRELSLTYKSQDARIEPSDYVVTAKRDIRKFLIDYSEISVQDVVTGLGQCKRIEIPSHAAGVNWSLRRVVDIDLCPTFPQSAIFTTSYRNTGTTPLEIERVVQLAQTIRQRRLWTFQGASLIWGRDTVFALPPYFQAENPMGQMMPNGQGGGIPANDFWSGDVGMAIGHIEPDAVACWMPVDARYDMGIQVRFETRPARLLAPQETLSTPRAFITVHKGDFYEPLATYSAMLRAQKVSFLKPSRDLYAPVWWTYAFGHNFRPREVYNSIPKFKELGIKWIILNNRWWDHYGDWMPRSDKFGTEAGFKQMLGRLHQNALKSLLWWLPYGVQVRELPRSGLYNDPEGRPKQSPEIEKMISATATVALRHRDWLIEDQQGKLIPITRDLASLCPAYPPARDYMVQLARRMVVDWKADGFYMDDVFTVPSCYNPVHHHASPYDSVEQLGSLFHEFREIIEQHNPQGMLMICPCGTTINHCLLPSTNEPVTADPIGSQQIRWRIKMYKALMGPTAPVFADRVESTQFKRIHSTQAEVGTDFASCLGTGGILGTIFIWPKIDKLPADLEYRGELEGMERLLLTPEKATLWKKWFDLYWQKMLSTGEFLNLYTVGFDLLEGYVIRKQDRLFYAFFPLHLRLWGLEKPPALPEPTIWPYVFHLELRGLQKSKSYQVVDYERGRSLGQVDGSTPYIKADFTDHLLLEAIPLN